jgi:hypothetical protein
VLGFAVPFTNLSNHVQKCWAKTILLSQIGMFLSFFIELSFARPHTEHLELTQQ